MLLPLSFKPINHNTLSPTSYECRIYWSNMTEKTVISISKSCNCWAGKNNLIVSSAYPTGPLSSLPPRIKIIKLKILELKLWVNILPIDNLALKSSRGTNMLIAMTRLKALFMKPKYATHLKLVLGSKLSIILILHIRTSRRLIGH